MEGLEKIGIFRMTHIDNIPHILQNGITHAQSPDANPNYISIGDTSLITNRNQFVLFNGRKLGEYIPFYFGRRTPMLYVIQKGYNMVNPVLPENIVYCVSTVQKILDFKLPFLFTNGHATSALTSVFEQDRINELNILVKKDDINATFWKKEDDTDLKRRKEAEFLIASDVPPDAIVFWIVFNDRAKKKLTEMGITDALIHIRPQDYY